MTSVAATSAAAEEASRSIMRARERHGEEGLTYITDAAGATSPTQQLKAAGRSLWGSTTRKFSRRSMSLDPVAAEQVEHARQRLKEIHGTIIEPTGSFMGYWDGITFSSLIFTAVVTPVEVAFSGTKPLRFGKDINELPLFMLNRIVDAVFISDFCMQFFMGYEENNKIVRDKRKIARRYLTSWAIVDFVSSVPLEMFLLIYQFHDCSNRSPPVNVASESCSQGALKNFIKIFRLLRLLKLFRVIRASRILKRWEAAAVFVFTYTEISMMRFFVMLVMYAHWNACLWGMVAHPDIQPDYNWMFRLEETMNANAVMRCRVAQDHPALSSFDNPVDAVNYLDSVSLAEVSSISGVGTYQPHWAPYGDDKGGIEYRTDYAPACELGYEGKRFQRNNVLHKYCASLYFAVYTMTGIGLGDISATGNLEVMVATAIMLCGAVFWAYMIGQFVTLVSHIDVPGQAFRQRMDAMNYMMHDKKFSKDLKRKCRMFLMASKEHQRQVNYKHLEKLMSVSLRDDVAGANNTWVSRVWYLRNVTPPFVVDLSQAIQRLVYAPTEIVDLGLACFVITNGIGARKGRIISRHGVWGEDFLLDNISLIDMVCTAALSYLEVICLPRNKMIKLLSLPKHEVERKIVRKAMVFYTVRAKIVEIGSDALQKRLREERRSLATSPGGLRTPGGRSSMWHSFLNSDAAFDHEGRESRAARELRESTAKRRQALARTMTFVSYPSPSRRPRGDVGFDMDEDGTSLDGGLDGGLGRSSPTPDHPADLRASDGDIIGGNELANQFRVVSTAVVALEGRARDESRARQAGEEALHAKLDRLLAAVEASKT